MFVITVEGERGGGGLNGVLKGGMFDLFAIFD